MGKKKFGLIFTIVVLAVLIFFLIKDINFFEIWELLLKLKGGFLFLAIVAYFCTFAIWAFRWQHFFKGIFKGKVSFLLLVLYAGGFFNSITPGWGVGGEPFKAYFLSKKYKKPQTKILGYILADKVFQLFTFAIFAIFSILFVLVYIQIPNNIKLILEILLLAVIFSMTFTIFFTLKKLDFKWGIIFKKLHFLKFIKNRFETPENFEKFLTIKINLFIKSFKKVLINKKNIYYGISLSLLFWFFHFAVSYFLFLAFGIHINFLSVVMVITLGMLLATISPLPSGAGAIEALSILLYSAIGVNFSLAILVTLLTRIVFYFHNLFIGSLSLTYLKMTMGNGVKIEEKI